MESREWESHQGIKTPVMNCKKRPKSLSMVWDIVYFVLIVPLTANY